MSDERGEDVARPWPGAISAVTLVQEDLAEAKDFYRRVFGLPVYYEDASSAVFRFGPTLINLLASDAAPELVDPLGIASAEAGARAVMTLEVDDVDATCERLVAAGVALLNGPMDRPWGIRTASFATPEVTSGRSRTEPARTQRGPVTVR